MPTNASGFPACTKWKNYRYPLTLLPYDVGFTHDKTAQGAFGSNLLDIWISDDWFLEDLNTAYGVKMTTGAADKCTTLYRPGIWTGETTQNESTVGTTNPHFVIQSTDSASNLDVVSSNASTIGSVGNPQSLYTIAPGLHFGFRGTSTTAYATGDVFTWTMSNTALNNLGKVMDGTYTCWYKLPIDAGSTVVTEPLPAGIANKSMNIMWNGTRHIGKRATSAANTGQSMILQGSSDGTVWTDIITLMDDIDTADVANPMHNLHWDSNALDGSDLHYKRLKFVFEATSSEIDYHPNQYIQVNITPN